jgi:hypothetical protein
MYEEIKEFINRLHMDILARGDNRMLNDLFKLAHLISEVFREKEMEKTVNEDYICPVCGWRTSRLSKRKIRRIRPVHRKKD